MSSDSRNFAALDWVVHEITDTLREARDALEAYVENPKDEARLRFCLTHIHQVHGSLQMVEFYGAAMMAEEMEQLAQAMINDAVANVPEAQEVLMRAILQFPVYLEKVKNSRRDNPIIVLPLLNDLRAVRGESLLTETKLFSPHLAPAHQVSGERLPMLSNNAQFQDTVRKLRKMYQYAAAAFIRGINPDENLAYLKKVFERLYKLTRGTARQPLWHICTALVEALELDAIESSVSIKNLLRQLDRELQQMAMHGLKVLDSFTDDQLIKNLLYYVARSGQTTSDVAADSYLGAVYARYELERALPEGRDADEDGDQAHDLLSAPDADAMNSVVAALKSELEVVKRALDVSLSDFDRQHAMEEALPVIKRVADTMAVLGIGDLRKQVLEQGAVLAQLAHSGHEPNDDELMTLAGQVLAVENSLESLAANTGRESGADGFEADLNLTRAHASVLRESRSGLEQTKDAIVEYIASQWDRSHLHAVPATLRGIRGGLDIIPLARPARIIGACARYVEEQLIEQEATPEWAQLDTLADAITSVEYYLERFDSENAAENDLLLGVAEESVAQLGYAVAKTPPKPDADPAEAAAQAAAESELTDGLDADAGAALSAAYESALTEEPQATDAMAADESQLSSDLTSDLTLPTSDAPEGVPARESATDDRGYSVDSLAAEVAAADADEQDRAQPLEPAMESADAAPAEHPEPGTGTSVSTQAPVTDDDEDDVDEEILEIFIEEAGEVSEAIGEYFPRWARNFADQDALTEFRRAFHTLKGSGRMVGATDIGELAWSVENMLNRILEGNVKPAEPHVNVIERVRSLLPDMIEAFRTRQPNPHADMAGRYAEYAAALSQNQTPEPLPELSAGPSRPEAGSVPDEAREPLGETLETARQADAHADAEQDSDDDDRDSQLWEIFGIEALTHLQVVSQYIREMEEVAPLFTPPSDATQRALHTLKGSAHMANITPVAELATPLERFVKELRSYQIDIDEDILQLLRDGVDYTELALVDIEQGNTVEIPRLSQFVARVNELREIFVAPLARQQEAESKGQKAIDPELLAIFMAEEMKLLLDADKILEAWAQEPEPLEQLHPLQNELATLTKGALHANLPPMADLADILYRIVGGVINRELACSRALCDALIAGHLALLDLMDAVAVGQNLEPAPTQVQEPLEQFLAELSAAYRQDSTEDHTEDIAEEAPEALAPADAPSADPDPIVEEEVPATETGTDETGTDTEPDSAESPDPEKSINADTDIGADETLTPPQTARSDYQEEPSVTFDAADIEPSAHNEEPSAEQEPSAHNEEPSAHNQEPSAHNEEPSASEEPEALTQNQEAPAAVDDADREARPEVESSEAAAERARRENLASEEEEIDEEILEIFLEEADDLIEDIDRALSDWQDDWGNAEYPEELKRSLHTLKGGARLSGITDVGDMAHDFETLLIGMSERDTIDQAFFQRLTDYHDKIHAGTERMRARMAGHTAAAESPGATTAAPPSVTSSQTSGAPWPQDDQANVVPFVPKAKPGSTATTAPAPPASGGAVSATGGGGSGQVQHLAARRSGPQEVVRVSAELLEELVNLAGETSITRGRIEEQVGDLGMAIDEMDSTVVRLQEQLRRLDIETEAQVLFRQEQMEAHEEFDPLEMDRYSQLQQLSRSLMESASDLLDLKNTLSDKNRDTETLLLQQSRINTDLQEGLMRSRMVPFSRLVPRLRRIVRQAAGELGKEVEFELDNIEGELDRSVLERMVAPLEHMLRNAVDHGIEPPQEREQLGKPRVGRIMLSLAREGSEVALRLVDDGRGINLDKVRDKAIERGLMTDEAQLSDRDVMQFILHAGFSTAEAVTQISGRGVGMDVVHSEIKQLGGSMFIDSKTDRGSEFIVRLPFTVSVNRALMIQIGDDYYAIPLNSIEGIVRVSPFELEHYYQDPEARFEYAGEKYQVRYLGTMLDSEANPKLDGQSLPLPVVLVRSAENTVALQVDRLLGSSEVVVKTLGVQFSTVTGVSGATVMGDGSVVVILDPHALMREKLALGLPAATLLEPAPAAAKREDTSEKTIMVVDDSVTVRKVTGRFLEREGFRVITAKDGAEALLALQDHIPDVMLLDIEMPRMDGFEVASNMRSSNRLKDIPIIMITSRTGEKHRERAFNIGVDKYMGKPYQEELLLNNIRELLDKAAQRS